MSSSTGHGNHAVQAHAGVAHNSGLDGRHQRGAAGKKAAMFVVLLGQQQLDADPEQGGASIRLGEAGISKPDAAQFSTNANMTRATRASVS
ncbi:MAG TPA: hypothetical protein VLQ47_04830 [Rhodoferax sp.]|nr:hypothetical protein [Rhodoferax sp.]